MILILNGDKEKIEKTFTKYFLYDYANYKIVVVDTISENIILDEKKMEKLIGDLGEKYVAVGFNLDYFDPFNIFWIYWRGYSIVDALSIVIHLRYFIDGYVFYLPGILVDSIHNGRHIRRVVEQVYNYHKIREKCGYREEDRCGRCIFDGEFAEFYKEFLNLYNNIYNKKNTS
ncbi:MAG: hypothetical protein LRS47_03375 [Desulfurococcales archaeon]|nr:hypothetical protein [Desulfurococcales archaeon]